MDYGQLMPDAELYRCLVTRLPAASGITTAVISQALCGIHQILASDRSCDPGLLGAGHRRRTQRERDIVKSAIERSWQRALDDPYLPVEKRYRFGGWDIYRGAQGDSHQNIR